MFPLLWKEEHVFYLKMSSFDCTFLLAHRAGWSPSVVLSQYCVPFLHSCISSLQCTLISASICSLLFSSGGRYAACGQGPHSQYPALPLSQVLLNKAMGKRLPSDSMCVCVYVEVRVHTWSGRWGAGGGACVSEVRGCVCSILALQCSQQASSPQPCQFSKASCKCSLIFLANIPQTALSAWRIPHTLLSVVYVMKTMDFVSGFPVRMYRIIWNVLLKNYTTTGLFPVPLKT